MELDFNRFFIQTSYQLNSFLQKCTNIQRLFKISSKNFLLVRCFNLSDDLKISADHLKVHTNRGVKILMKVLQCENFILNEFFKGYSLFLFDFECFLEDFIDLLIFFIFLIFSIFLIFF